MFMRTAADMKQQLSFLQLLVLYREKHSFQMENE